MTNFRDWLDGLGCRNYHELEESYGREMASMMYAEYRQEQRELATH
ncbi:hypothetical protein [Weissella viridescens]